jgi:hypothetical protein
MLWTWRRCCQPIFELGVKSIAEVVEESRLVCTRSTPELAKRRFPMSQQTYKPHTLKVEAGQGTSNSRHEGNSVLWSPFLRKLRWWEGKSIEEGEIECSGEKSMIVRMLLVTSEHLQKRQSPLSFDQFPSINVETEQTACLPEKRENRNRTNRLKKGSFYFSATHCTTPACCIMSRLIFFVNYKKKIWKQKYKNICHGLPFQG